MRKCIQALFILTWTLIHLPAFTEQIRPLTWDDLIPTHLSSEDSLAHLTQEEQDLTYWVINTLETLPPRAPDTEEFYREVDEAMRQLKKAGIDINEEIAKRRIHQTSIVEGLNGQEVRIPGYLLPLEVLAAKVTEFLLVPYVGACIHVPPPPPNQIIYVQAAPKKGYRIKKLYETVWVTGVISVKSMVKDLYFVDGTAAIDIGYALQANRIEPYKDQN